MEETLPALYERVLDGLRIPEKFLQAHEKEISRWLQEAALAMGRKDEEHLGINRCLHLASSVILRNPEHLNETLTALHSQESLENQDPTIMLTMAMLYNLLKGEIQRQTDETQKQNIERIRQRLNELNWLMGCDAMRALGFENADQ